MKKLLLVISFYCFFTFVNAQTTHFSENFEFGFPANWQQTTLASDGGWIVGNSGSLSSTYFPFDAHTNFIATNDDKCDCNKSNDLLQTPAIDLQSQTGTLFLTFESYFFKGSYNGNEESATVEVSIDSGATWTILKNLIGNETWTKEFIDISAYAGETIWVGFRYKDANDWLYGWGIDDIEIVTPVDYDFEMTALDLQPYFKIGTGNYSINGTITNYGKETITSFDINYMINSGAVVTGNISGVSIAPLTSYNFTHPTPFVPTVAGATNIMVYASNLNGNADMITDNDVMSFEVLFYVESVERMPFYEIFTSSTCGPCTPGNENFHNIVNNYPGKYVSIKYQQDFPGTGDPYCTDESVSRRNFYSINSIPRMEIDGGWDGNANNFTSQLHDEAKLKPSFLEISSTFSTADSGRTINVNVTMNPVADLTSPNYRLYIALVENLTTKNKKSNGETKFLTVMKKMLPDENGTQISNFTSGNATTHQTSFTFNGDYRLPFNGTAVQRIDHSSEHSVEEFEDLAVVVWVQDNNTKEVLQAANATYVSVSVPENTNNNTTFNLYPNPTTSETNVYFSLANEAESKIQVIDLAGKLVFEQTFGVRPSGNYMYKINGNIFEAGLYQVILTTGNQVQTKKLSVIK